MNAEAPFPDTGVFVTVPYGVVVAVVEQWSSSAESVRDWWSWPIDGDGVDAHQSVHQEELLVAEASRQQRNLGGSFVSEPESYTTRTVAVVAEIGALKATEFRSKIKMHFLLLTRATPAGNGNFQHFTRGEISRNSYTGDTCLLGSWHARGSQPHRQGLTTGCTIWSLRSCR